VPALLCPYRTTLDEIDPTQKVVEGGVGEAIVERGGTLHR
jgi:hypothetical protein